MSEGLACNDGSAHARLTMRSISVLLLTALLSSSCSWLGPEPELVCGPYDSDPDRCDAVLTVAAQAFPDAVRLEILDRETPQLLGAWWVYVEATCESGATQTLVCGATGGAPMSCAEYRPTQPSGS